MSDSSDESIGFRLSDVDSEDSSSDSSDYLLVAAIDIGTTFSGFAFSFRHQYEDDPTQICANTWAAGSAALISLKTSTCALFKPDGTFHSFGYEAEDTYSELNLKRGLMLEEENGKTKPAIEVISHSIGYLKDRMMETCKKQQTDIRDSDVLWVLTVPAIWNDPAKQFMREAAEMAGIKSNRLILALEPEAASLFCMRLPVEKFSDGMQKGFSAFQAGSKYIVLDAGGGTIDITVHEVQPDNTLKELHKANGGDWGGTKVDEAFRMLLAAIVGNDVMGAFCQNHKTDMLDLYRDFEVKKRTITPKLNSKITFKVPISLNETHKGLNSGKEIKDSLASKAKYKDKVGWIGDKLRMDADLAKGLYDCSIKQIVAHLRELLTHDSVQGCSAILMVGGFSESPMLQEAIRSNFKHLRVIVPSETGLSVLKGAVVYGHDPSTIKYRVCKYTYGVETSEEFNPFIHDETKKFTDNSGIEFCGEIFSKHVEVGQTVVVGEPQVEQSYKVVYEEQTGMKIEVYISSETDPKYVTDPSCKQLGIMEVEMPNVHLGLDRSVQVSMTFSGTELHVEAINEQDGESTKATFDLLE
ncbi:hypothetical protein KUTeg_021119 [Tegillarca granosa]|uniref:Heat shock 70 kDa protein 12A n=1 Tax=Tegillarca granosa TaxID=220873 RepID=A0ABQ9EE02_TEGGR|nr:hypothetical protein KUTeg_021119 [Tegillarca granosa]